MQPLGMCKQNIGNYEGFALWMESLLCGETGNGKIWDLKKSGIHTADAEIFGYFQDAEQKLTRFGFMSQLGFPKHYTSGQIIGLLRHFYADRFNDIDLVMLYGSQKPYSDIDLFVVSGNKSRNQFNGWLDVYELNREEFRERVDCLDISVTDPLFSGRLIFGEESYFNRIKQDIVDMPISYKAVNYNRSQSMEQEDYLQYFEDCPRDKSSCLSYISSYSRNAQELQKGRKALILKNLSTA